MAFDLRRALLADEGKALGPHPALLDRTTPLSVYSPGANRTKAKISQREAQRHSEAYGGKEAIDWVYDCVGLYADTASSAAWHLEREDGTKLVRTKSSGTPFDAEVGPKELYELLDRPNPFMLYDELVSLLIIDLLLVGNAYWYKWRTNEQGKPLAIYRLAPGHVNIIPGAFGPESYEYQPPGAREPLQIDPKDIVHVRLPNPHSHYYGLGVIQGGGRPFDLELALTDTQASYYENKADPSLIVESERRVPRDIFQKLRMQLRSRVAGTSRSGELLVLEAGLKAKTLTPSAREALFDTLTKLSRDRILAMFRASPKLFGVVDTATGSDKVADARREFDTYTIRPFMDKLQTRITDGLTEAWGLKFKIDYRYIMPMEELVKNASSFGSVPGVKVREIRSLLAPLGISESTGDREIDEMVLNIPGEELDEDGQGGFADRPLTSEPGRPPKGENTKAFPKGGRLPKGARVRESGKALADIFDEFELLKLQKELEYAEEGKAITLEPPARTTIGNKLPDEKRPKDSFAVDRERDVDAAAALIEESLVQAAGVLERGLLDHVEGKALRTNDLRKRLRNSKSWTTFRNMVEASLEEGVKRAVSAAVMNEARAGRRAEEELDYSTIVSSVVHRPEGLRSIVKTLKERVLKRVAKELEKDQPIQTAIQSSVQNTLLEWKREQAPMIGVTEAVVGYNEGTLTVAEALDYKTVFVTDGDDHDEPCQEANGSVWTIEEARERRLEHPNCRRAFLLVDEVAS